MCREGLKGFEPNPCRSMETMIVSHIGKLGESSLRTTYEDRIRDAETRKKSLQLSSDLIVGSKVDIRDEKFDWNVGEIVNIVDINGLKHLIVRYRDSSRQYEEMLLKDDPRLAPYRSHRHENFFFEGPQNGLFELLGRNTTSRLRVVTNDLRSNFMLFRSMNVEESHELSVI